MDASFSRRQMVGAAAALPIIAALPAVAKAAPRKKLKIGIFMPHWGAAAYIGRQGDIAARWWATYANEADPISINGVAYDREMVFADDAMTPEGAIAAARQLVDQGVHCVVGPLIGVDAVGPVFEAAGIPYHAAMSGTRESGPDLRHKLIYPPVRYYTAEWLVLVRKNHPEIRTVAILGSSDPHNQNVQRTVPGSVAKSGAAIVANEVYDVERQDFSDKLRRILKLNPDSLSLMVAPHDAAAIITEARGLGYDGWAQTSISAEHLQAMKPEHVHKIMSIVPDFTGPAHNARTKLLYQAFRSAHPDESWGLNSATSLNSIMMFEAAFRHANSVTGADVLATFDNPEFSFRSLYKDDARIGGFKTYGIRRVPEIGCEYGEIVDPQTIRLSMDISVYSVP